MLLQLAVWEGRATVLLVAAAAGQEEMMPREAVRPNEVQSLLDLLRMMEMSAKSQIIKKQSLLRDKATTKVAATSAAVAPPKRGVTRRADQQEMVSKKYSLLPAGHSLILPWCSKSLPIAVLILPRGKTIPNNPPLDGVEGAANLQ